MCKWAKIILLHVFTCFDSNKIDFDFGFESILHVHSATEKNVHYLSLIQPWHHTHNNLLLHSPYIRCHTWSASRLLAAWCQTSRPLPLDRSPLRNQDGLQPNDVHFHPAQFDVPLFWHPSWWLAIHVGFKRNGRILQMYLYFVIKRNMKIIYVWIDFLCFF
jgi:hypothetical protein